MILSVQQAFEAGGARRLWNESFFSAPQLKRGPFGRRQDEDDEVKTAAVWLLIAGAFPWVQQ